MSKYIEFIDTSIYGQKTKRYDIHSIDQGTTIGEIKWFPAWRKYCFFPRATTVFETVCLTDIIEFIKELTKQRNSKC